MLQEFPLPHTQTSAYIKKKKKKESEKGRKMIFTICMLEVNILELVKFCKH